MKTQHHKKPLLQIWSATSLSKTTPAFSTSDAVMEKSQPSLPPWQRAESLELILLNHRLPLPRRLTVLRHQTSLSWLRELLILTFQMNLTLLLLWMLLYGSLIMTYSLMESKEVWKRGALSEWCAICIWMTIFRRSWTNKWQNKSGIHTLKAFLMVGISLNSALLNRSSRKGDLRSSEVRCLSTKMFYQRISSMVLWIRSFLMFILSLLNCVKSLWQKLWRGTLNWSLLTLMEMCIIGRDTFR